ncbi:MAG: carbon-nitrogen hydrolase family protein [Candidatus Brocadiia bacterium]
MKSPLKVAACQIGTSPSLKRNADKVCEALKQIRDLGCHLAVFPECILSGYLPQHSLSFSLLKEHESQVVEYAGEQELWVALGTTTERDDGWYNTARLYSPDGDCVATYDKTELTGADRNVFEPGQNLEVIQVGEWKIGLQICFDMRFPENWRILRRQGAEMIIHLSNASRSASWKVPVLEGTVRCRAAENGMYVVSANDARKPQMMVSAICDPNGKHLACAEENQETIIHATLDRKQVKTDYLEKRRTDLWSQKDLQQYLLE